MKTFIEVEWPVYQEFIMEDWWPEKVHFGQKNGISIALIPEALLKENNKHMNFLNKVRNIQEQKQKRIALAEHICSNIYEEIEGDIEYVEHPKYDGKFNIVKYDRRLNINFIAENRNAKGIQYLAISVKADKMNTIVIEHPYYSVEEEKTFKSTSGAINYIAEYIGNL